MKKITLFVITLCIVTNTYAQFIGAGEYRLRNNFTTNGTVYLSHDGSKAIRATSTDSDATKFTLVSTGVADEYNIVIHTNDGILRANSTSEIPVVAYSGSPSTSNPNVWSVVDTGSTGSSGETIYNILTPLTSSARYLVYNNNTDAIGYSGSNFTRTQWILERLSPPLSTNDLEKSSVFISNPIHDKMTIKGLKGKVNQIEIFNVLGELMISRSNINSLSINIETNSLSSGLYLVKFYGETFSFTKKIIKK